MALSLLGIVALLGAAFSSSESSTGLPGPIQSASYEQIRELAERFYDEGSYSLAREQYQRVAEADLDADERRWVDFRLADTTWRAQAGSRTSDNTTFERARQQLEELIAAVSRVEDRDLV